MAGEKDNVKVRTHRINTLYTTSEYIEIQKAALRSHGKAPSGDILCGPWLRDLALREVGLLGYREENK